MIYSRIKEICTKNKISIRSLEIEAGLSNGTVSKWNRVSPTVNKLISVAKILNVEIEELLK